LNLSAEVKFYKKCFWNKHQVRAKFTSVSMNEIADAVFVHKIDPRLNILSTKFKTNEQIEAQKFIYISLKLSESCLEVVCAGIYLDLKN